MHLLCILYFFLFVSLTQRPTVASLTQCSCFFWKEKTWTFYFSAQIIILYTLIQSTQCFHSLYVQSGWLWIPNNTSISYQYNSNRMSLIAKHEIDCSQSTVTRKSVEFPIQCVITSWLKSSARCSNRKYCQGILGGRWRADPKRRNTQTKVNSKYSFIS